MLQQQSNAATDLQQALGPQPRNPLDRTSEPFLHLILRNGFAREATVPSDKTRSPAHTASIVRLVKQGLPLADLFLFRRGFEIKWCVHDLGCALPRRALPLCLGKSGQVLLFEPERG